MSHFATIETQMRDIAALKTACAELGLEIKENAVARGYGANTQKGEFVIRLKRDKALGKAQSLVEAEAESADNIILAKGNAEKTLRLLFKQLGWDVEIRWQCQDNDNP